MALENEVAAAFGLGTVVGEWAPVAGGGSHRMFRLSTTSGEWAVKWLNRSREAWWLREHLLAAEVERTAAAAGVAMPRRCEPLLAEIPVDGEPAAFQAHEWVHGRPVGPGDAEVSAWVGATMAVLHRVGAPAAADERELYPVSAWRTWLRDADVELAAVVRAALPVVDTAVGVVAGCRDGLTAVCSHRDVSAGNVLIGDDGPVLLDWDSAGPEVAEWEVTRAALAFGGDEPGFRRVVAAYEAAGGPGVPRSRAAFAGVLQGHLVGAQWTLWRALGHRPVTPPERAASRRACVAHLAELERALIRLDEWTTWLNGATAG